MNGLAAVAIAAAGCVLILADGATARAELQARDAHESRSVST